MKKRINITRWIMGILLILAGCIALGNTEERLSGFFMLLFGISLLPVVTAQLKRFHLGEKLNRFIAIAVPVLLISISAYAAPQEENQPAETVWESAKADQADEKGLLPTPTATEIPTPEPTPEAEQMSVHFIDVGQADSIFIDTPSADMLIDAGENEDGAAVVSYLQQQGVTKLDYVIGSHPHEDHIGGMDDVIHNFEIGMVILPGKAHTSQTYMEVLQAIQDKGLGITQAVTGDTYALGTAEFTILSPNADADYGDELNNWSVGIRLVNGENSFVFTGDAEARTEKDILNTGIDLKADVFKAGHHGSETSNSEALLDAVNPDSVVISCGKGNQYGHPDLSVLDLFQRHGLQIFRTDEQGTVVAKSDGADITWSTAPSTSMTPGTKPSEAAAAETPSQPPSQSDVQHVVESTPEATPEPTEQPQQTQGEMVWIPETGSKYHSIPDCGRMNPDKAYQMSQANAEAQGYGRCKKCW